MQDNVHQYAQEFHPNPSLDAELITMKSYNADPEQKGESTASTYQMTRPKAHVPWLRCYRR